MARIYQTRPGGARGEGRQGKAPPSPSAPIQAKPAGTDDPGAAERAERFGHDFSQIRIGPGRPREDRGRSLPSHRPGCGCPSCAGRTRDQGPAPVAASPAADSGSGKAIQLCRICGRSSCTDESRHVSSADAIMETVDTAAELRHAMRLADSRFRYQSSTAVPGPHLSGSTEVRGVDRRSAEVREPVDRLLLAAEPRRGPGDANYTQLRQSAGPTSEPLVVGRFQDPTSRNAAPRERHIYEQGSRGAPSYPREASHLSALSNPFAALERAMLVEPMTDVPDEASQRHVMTTANILGIAEQRRDPFMALSSAQTIVRAARTDEPPTPSGVFGRRQGRQNLPGTLSASGTGAVAAFRGFRSDLETAAPPSTTSSERLRENISEQHTDLMRMSIDQGSLDRRAAEGHSPAFIRDAAVARARSAATRQAARMTGQLRYNLRSLLPPPSEREAMGEDDFG